MLQIKVATSCIAALALSTAWAAAPEQLSQSARILSCEDGYTRDTSVGRLANNMWNKQAANGAPHRQCMLVRGDPAAPQYGWSWEWPMQSETLLAYPQTLFGWKPWNGGAATTGSLPIRIASIKRLRLNYRVNTSARGKYNLASAVWLTRSGRTSEQPNAADISADINVWMNNRGVVPSGKQIATVHIGGIDFAVWHTADMGDASAANSNRWQHVVYLAQAANVSGEVDIGAFVQDAVERGFVSPAHYVSSIELGNEIVAGSGETWIDALTLRVD